jgi:ribosomal protein S18 acetylase RimI-like enzyme
MSKVRIHIVTDDQDPLVDQLAPLFEDLHASMSAHGMNASLGPEGARIWTDGARRGLERFGRLVLAVQDGVVVGFTYGVVKLAPEYLGGELLGHWTHLYVVPEQRRGGVAQALTTSLHDWFGQKGVKATECEVVHENLLSQGFVRSLGYRPELFRFRRPA